MEKIKRIAFAAALIAVVSVAVACGRNDNNGTGATQSSTASSSAETPSISGTSAGDTGNIAEDNSGSSMDRITDEDRDTGTGNNTDSQTNEETGGVLRDMVDDVLGTSEDAKNRSDAGTSGASGSTTGRQ